MCQSSSFKVSSSLKETTTSPKKVNRYAQPSTETSPIQILKQVKSFVKN